VKKQVDLESAIMAVWQTVDDLQLFTEFYYDGPKEMTVDEVYNHVEGIRAILNLRMEKLWDQYRRKFELDQYCTDPEKLALREKLIKQLKKGNKK
jgi:hypothetical protein